VRTMVVGSVGSGFRAQFGRHPEGVWSAPGRVNLIGEHTDYNQGLALPIGLPLRAFVAARRRPDRIVRLWSAQTSELVTCSLDDLAPGVVKGWSAYAVGVLWALEQNGFGVHGIDLAIDGQVPLGAGLSSSAALECAVAVAASELFALGLHGKDDTKRAELAALCAFAENAFVQAPTGGMDQLASLRCQADHAMLLDIREGTVEQVPLPLAEHGLAILVMDTQVEHALVDGQYASRRQACERAAAALGVESLREIDAADLDSSLRRLPEGPIRHRVRHVVTEIDRVIRTVESLRAVDFEQVGKLFDASHESLRYDFEVSCPELDLAVQTARDSGALGARMTGAGFGGSAIALVPGHLLSDVADAVVGAFAAAGCRPPACFEVRAGPPAGRDL
jgi:galactokinase